MAIMVGSARIDERGKISGGAVGDQKQKSSAGDTIGEVSQQNMYVHSKGWYILRPKKADHAKKIAKKMIKACDNANLGYDQGNRYGIITYGIGAKTKTECDCSSLVRACVKEATGKDPGDFNTSSEASALEATGLFEKRQSYVSQAKTPVYDGDILVTKFRGHTVIVTSGSPRPSWNAKGRYPKYTGNGDSIVKALETVGEKDTSMSHRKKIAAANGISDYTGTASQNLGLVKLLKAGKLKKA